jgi:hypothetical protein
MRLSLAWYSVRRLMVVVAVIAALVWAGMECVGLWERARHYNSPIHQQWPIFRFIHLRDRSKIKGFFRFCSG